MNGPRNTGEPTDSGRIVCRTNGANDEHYQFEPDS